VRKIRVTGDSHTTALRAGLDALRAAGEIPAELDLECRNLCSGADLHQPFFTRNRDRVTPIAGQLRQALTLLTGGPGIGPADNTIYGLSMGCQTLRVFKADHWRAYAPWRVAEAATPLSDQVMNLAFADDDRFIFDFFAALQALGVPIFVIASPPPQDQTWAIRRGTRPAVVREIDRLYRQWVTVELARRGVPFLSPPKDVTDSNGFLRPEYQSGRENDHAHANAAYGALVFRQIFALAADWPAQQPATTAADRAAG